MDVIIELGAGAEIGYLLTGTCHIFLVISGPLGASRLRFLSIRENHPKQNLKSSQATYDSGVPLAALPQPRQAC